MRGDVHDMRARLRALLPARWFADDSPNLNALLTCLATPWAWLYELLDYVARQTRVTTASGVWLDRIALDFFGTTIRRLDREPDAVFRARIQYLLFRPAATRQAIALAIEHLTGAAPWIFEPSNPLDTGSYGESSGGSLVVSSRLAYCCAGGWGSLALPNQFFMVVHRPNVAGLSGIPGYGSFAAGYGAAGSAYVDLASLPGALTEREIFSAVSSLLPVGTTGWLRVE